RPERSTVSMATNRFEIERAGSGWSVVEVFDDWPDKQLLRKCHTKRMAEAIAAALIAGIVTLEQAELIVTDTAADATRKGIQRPHTHAVDFLEVVFRFRLPTPPWWLDFRRKMVARDSCAGAVP